jgi:hypothetical protein
MIVTLHKVTIVEVTYILVNEVSGKKGIGWRLIEICSNLVGRGKSPPKELICIG